MNAPLRNPIKFDVQGLVQAVQRNDSEDKFAPSLTPQQWETLGSYLQPFAVTNGQVLIEQGATDRTLYMVESGSLTVHYEDSKSRVRLAVVSPGSAVGEGAFFSRQPRNATVQAGAPSKIWSLTPLRFSELSKRQPELALEIALALGALVSHRLACKPRRVAVT
jgi:CRP/FNR family transcriptional regulator, cyclic AMP receptor protein